MIRSLRKQLPDLLGVGILLWIAYGCRYWNLADSVPEVFRGIVATCCAAIRNVIHIFLLMLWCMNVRERVISPLPRRYMTWTGMLLAFWLMARMCKGEFTMDEQDPLGRLLWYSMVIPAIMIPVLGLFLADCIGKPEEYRTPGHLKLLLVPAAVLVGAVYTNDFHQLVFGFPGGIGLYDSNYRYGPLFLVIMLWVALLCGVIIRLLLVKKRLPGLRKVRLVTPVVLISGILFWVMYSLRLIQGEIVTVGCITIVLFLESAIQSGLIPSNTNYREIFDKSSIHVQIADRNNRICYASAGAQPFSQEQILRAEERPLNLGDIMLNCAPITAGKVLWADDVAPVNRLMEELREIRSQLDEENVLLHAETELKERHAIAKEQNRLYDRIAKEVEPQLLRAEELVRRMEQSPEHTRAQMARLCIYGSYIKRRGNLLLLGEEQSRIHTRELEFCIRESLENLSLADVDTFFDARCTGDAPAEQMIGAYDLYETLTEAYLETMTAMMVLLAAENGGIHLRIQMGLAGEAPSRGLENLSVPGGVLRIQAEDEDITVDLTFREEGGGEI